MKKILLLASVVCLAATNVSAFEFNPYVAAKAKYGFARNEIKATGVEEGKAKFNDNIWGGSFAVGNIYSVMNGDFRLELEYTKNSDAEKNHVKVATQGLLFNIYYDFNLRTTIPVKPYVGIGLGWGRSEFKGGNQSVKEDGASMQIGTGISYQLCEHTNVDLGYRYSRFSKMTFKDANDQKVEIENDNHSVYLGVRHVF